MEKPQIGPSKNPFNFSGSHRSHLQSQTYNNLIRILSQCYNHPHLCKTPHFIITPVEANDGNEPREASERKVLEHGKVATPDVADCDDSLAQNNVSVENVEAVGFKDGRVSDSQAAIDEIENIMGIEEDMDTFKVINSVQDGTDGSNCFGDGDFEQLQQLLVDELELVMIGNEEVVPDKNCNVSVSSLEVNQSGDIGVAVLNNEEQNFDLDPVVKEGSRSEGLQQVDKKSTGQNTHETIDSLLDNIMMSKVLKLSDNNEEKTSSQISELGVDHEMKQSEMDSEKSSSNDAVGYSNRVEDGETEEGEIPSEYEVNDRPIDMSHRVSAVPEKQNKQLFEDFADKNNFPSNDKEEHNRKDSVAFPIAMTVNTVNVTDDSKVEAKDVGNGMACKRKLVVYGDPLLDQGPGTYKKQKKGSETKEEKKGGRDKGKKKGNVGSPILCSNNLAPPAKSSDQDAIRGLGIKSKEKLQQENGACKKKTRVPLSEERKEKKKEKKRKKRAQKNRELGVKRLKLRPVEKPKPVVLCRHYIKGRCHEGEKCKFSHDTVPLTKSKPCCHFARNSCLKGDDCPFDHQLSKYPCTNYASTGSCSRGEDCMFSHKLPLKEELPSTSNVCVAELKPPSLPHTLNSGKQLDSGGTSHHIAKASPDTDRNLPKSVASPHLPKGISFLSTGKSSVVESSHSTPGSSSLTRVEGLKSGNERDQHASSRTENSNEVPKGISVAGIPKGINFLSFGKAPMAFSGIKKLTINSGSESPLSNNFDLHKQPISPSIVSHDIQVGKETSQTVSNSTLWVNRMLQKTEHSVSPLVANKMSFSETSIDRSTGKVHDSLPSSSATQVDRSLQASEISYDKHQNSSRISQVQSASPLGSGQSADYSARLKKTPISAQKALVSTLAFAAKIESEMKMKQPAAGALAAVKIANKETGDIGTCRVSQNNLVQTSKILDFLSSAGEKMKR